MADFILENEDLCHQLTEVWGRHVRGRALGDARMRGGSYGKP